jgi:hypothetical protein
MRPPGPPRRWCATGSRGPAPAALHTGGLPAALHTGGAEEAEAVPALTGAGSARRWLAAWDRVRDLASAADGINLDRRQTALAALGVLREAAGRG